MVMKDTLDKLGYDVETADEYDALDKVKYLYPDTVIVNLIMKTTTGDRLIEKIKGWSSDVRCILSSSNDIKLRDFRALKVDEVIHTPVNKDELIRALECSVIKTHADISKNEMEDFFHRLKKKAVPENKINFCPYCGNKLKEDFQFCPHCGHKL
jgi:CheY-like chemotaxis protein